MNDYVKISLQRQQLLEELALVNAANIRLFNKYRTITEEAERKLASVKRAVDANETRLREIAKELKEEKNG